QRWGVRGRTDGSWPASCLSTRRSRRARDPLCGARPRGRGLGPWRAAPVRAADARRPGRSGPGRVPARVLGVGARQLRRPPPLPAPPFLMTVARNLFIDWARRAGRELPRSDILDGPLAGEGPAGGGAVGGGDAGEGGPSAGEGEPFAPAVVALADAYVQS